MSGTEPAPEDVERLIAGVEGALTIEALQAALRQEHVRAAAAEARVAAMEGVVARARRAIRYAQLDGGRHALQAALDDRTDDEPWPVFLAERLARLRNMLAAEARIMTAPTRGAQPQ